MKIKSNRFMIRKLIKRTQNPNKMEMEINMEQISNNMQKESDRGFLLIQLQKTTFISNEQIEGVLSIHLEKPFPGYLLELTLVGKEDTTFTYTIYEGSGEELKEKTIKAHGLNKFLSFSFPIYDFSQGRSDDQFKMNPGSWQIPFSFGIASALPSSMKFNNKLINCKLEYQLLANITPTAQNDKPLSASQDILITQYIQPMLGINSLEIIVTPLECCCCGSGSMKIGATVNKKTFNQNETIEVSLQCDLSNYSRKIDNIIVSLIGQLSLKGENPEHKTTVEILNQPQLLKVYEKIILDTVSILIPKNQLSVIGDFIIVNYFVSIIADIGSCLTIDDNTPLLIPITINSDQKQIQNTNIPPLNQVYLPSKWNPQLLEQYQFTQQQSLSYQQKQGNLSKLQQQIQSQEIQLLLERPQMIKANKKIQV